jgi:alkanesulfonate monooxygenase SsuD/methylene tetrahydromethanopterin reductase-like flavin-dependent oxidoreductase (luciferase family)
VKAAIFSRVPYLGPTPDNVWPAPASPYSSEVAQRSMDESLEQFQLADELGFDWVTVAEHHYSPFSLTPNPMILAGAMTQRVKRAKIALLGANIPIQNPLRVAEEFAMLDVMTGGRIVAGMLRGTANEYVTYGTNPAESRDRFAEALKLIVRAWTEPQPFGWQGRYYEYRAISIWPRPVQQPHPPIYMSGSSPESGEWAAQNRIGLGFAVTNVPLARKAAQHYREQANRAGWEPSPDDVLYRLGAHVADTDEQAIEDLEVPVVGVARLSRIVNPVVMRAITDAGYLGRDAANQAGRVMQVRSLKERIELGELVAGSPETVIRQIRSIKDELGAGILDLAFHPVGRDKTLKAIELFGTKVLPSMHDL